MGTFELINAVASLLLGGVMTLWSQGMKDRAEREKMALQAALDRHAATEASQKAAREFEGQAGFHYTRRAIALIVVICVFVMALQVSHAAANETPKIPTPSEADAIIAAEMLTRKQQAAARKAEIENVEAIEEWEINRGGKKVILRQTAPPPSAQKRTPQSVQPEWTKEQLALWLALQPEPRAIHLSAYVYDRSVTEVIWREPGGREWRIISNVDFNYLTGIGSFEDGTYAWSNFMALENVDTAAEQAKVLLAASQGVDYSPRTAPGAGLFASSDPEYLVYAESEAAVPEALYEELDALHQYYYAHRDRLIAEYERRKVLNKARQEWQKANPPQPKDTVINFWRVK